MPCARNESAGVTDSLAATNMHITVNAEKRELPERSSVEFLLGQLKLAGRLAVERNGEILPRSQYAQTVLADGDTLEIVHAIGGG